MKRKDWRTYDPKYHQEQEDDYEPPQSRRRSAVEPRRENRRKTKRRRKGGFLRKALWIVILFVLGYAGFMIYYAFGKPYTVALDAGHGGTDVGAVGMIQEVTLTEQTVGYLKELLVADGRFRVVTSRKDGETKGINERTRHFKWFKPDVVLSVHGNASDDANVSGFECYPAPPGHENHEVSMAFAQCVANEMANSGARLRGTDGIRFGYYITDENNPEAEAQKWVVDASDMTVYTYPSFGILRGFTCATVLVEQGFITNAEDVQNFAGEDGCKRAAEAYYRAICTYLEVEE